MKLFKSNEPNTFHYVTLVTYNRVPVFRSDKACEIFVRTLREVRDRFPYKLIGYVVMPDHAHAIVNNASGTISDWLRRVRGNSARSVLAWLREEQHLISLKKLALNPPQKRHHTHALWQKDPSVIDLTSPKFIRQKLNYVHLNPVRAGFANTPRIGSGQAIGRICITSLAMFRLKLIGKCIGKKKKSRRMQAGSSPPLTDQES